MVDIVGTLDSTILDSYASEAELAAYLGLDVGDITSDMGRMLERATDLVRSVTMGRSEEVDADDDETIYGLLSKAVCAQVEAWYTSGESSAMISGIDRYSIGKVSVDYGSASNRALSGGTGLCPRAYQYLMRSGLLYRGVGMVPRLSNTATEFFATEEG